MTDNKSTVFGVTVSGARFESLLDSLLREKPGFDLLTRSAIEPPSLPSNANQAECSEALVEALKCIAGVGENASLEDAEVERFANFFGDLYGGDCDFRHMYSDVSRLMYGFLEGERLDNGVPYQDKGLADNMNMIASYMDMHHVGQVKARRRARKLYDHIELENTRMEYMAKQNGLINESAIELGEMRQAFSRQIEETQSLIEEKIDATQRRLQQNYVTILGIFAAIVVAFVAGSTFTTSVLDHITTVSIYRLTFFSIGLGLFIFDLVASLYLFIAQVSELPANGLLYKALLAVNALGVIAMATLAIVRFFC